ncbi:hypothetical protein CEXT_573071 [Caerostris extrusa]|uniref:Uncharacterized protein n=1 Tax=Caerostris extrusa TaxID=172846 RepID=A0AAV4WMZ1_CAEEX|nr:hypothetical protein CEXT_573071 [Caerostris extrusa]
MKEKEKEYSNWKRRDFDNEERQELEQEKLTEKKDPAEQRPFCFHWEGEEGGQRLEQKRTSDDLIEWNGKTRFSRSYAGDRR